MAGFRLILVLLLTTIICNIQANDGASSSSSAPATLGIFFERAPESAVAPKGDEVVFECELNLKPDRLEWRFRRSGSTEPYRYLRPTAGYNVTSGSDDRAWRLRIYVSAQTAGDYQCVAWYGPGALASTPARLALVSIALDGGGQGSTGSRGSIRWSVAPKNCLLIRCGSVISNPPAIWSFYRNGKKLPQSELLSGAAGALVLDTVTAKDAGTYSCVATNAITGDELRLPQTIELRVDYTDRTPPYFLQRPPTEYSARPGETVVLECPGVGSPRPTVIWSSPNVAEIYNNRSKILPYGLQITEVRPEDQGSYICMLDNGIAPAIDHTIKLSVLQRPTILRGPASTLTNESNPLLLDCSATGNPQPDIYWLINGEDATKDPEAQVDNRSLHLRRVQKRHAGVVQCFAKNILGETSEGNMLRVNPLEITGEDDEPLGGVPMWPVHESNGGTGSSSTPSGGSKNKGGRRKYKANLVPPSRPNVTRLSDESVMLRWSVPQNSGYQITFFKVQYRRLGDGKNRRENWQTTSENIPFGNSYGSGSGSNHWRQRNRDREYEMGNPAKNFTSSVTGLTSGKYYRFRIVAVYSNNDNKEGNTSLKFFLQNGTAKSNLPVPDLREVEPFSESAVMLHWSLVSSGQNENIDGYYAYYRPTDSAAEYLKATVDGGRSRSFKVDLLRPGTAYEFKLQSFNSDAASDFSAIRQARTKKTNEQTASPSTPVPAHKTGDQQHNSIYPVIAGAAGGGLLLLIASVVACICLKRRENTQPEDENKPQLEHIQADFVTSAVLGVGGHHKSGDVRRLNGVIPRMNITPNPLAQEAASDKTNSGLHQNGLHHAQPYHPPGTPTLIHKRLDYHQQPPPVPPHSAYYQQAPTHQPSPIMERSIRGHQQPAGAGGGYHLEEGTPTPTRIPSLRRQRRTSGGQVHNSHSNLNLNLSHHNNNNNLPPHHQHLHHHPGHPGGLVGIPIVPGSPRVQRSPMPSRAMIKRTRMGSHTDNISSGSLNSIEV
ncbi:interference hedgehog isoform X1 [Drosophila ficusphila]|uniref:interference hedgehog isoform X1 n=1 Tax=Drosophila ficusphila TaxID=30025 RepID=UPI0007E69CA7|nr:interference hedgehog isoform X1 [Drosophila ficusphila]XP_017048112.1 interference hedgehog isoform X1 [Drosophila ficusphila]XP_017048113.1 interference hedgehog isoform X1 [Drosophila ficusphila]